MTEQMHGVPIVGVNAAVSLRLNTDIKVLAVELDYKGSDRALFDRVAKDIVPVSVLARYRSDYKQTNTAAAGIEGE